MFFCVRISQNLGFSRCKEWYALSKLTVWGPVLSSLVFVCLHETSLLSYFVSKTQNVILAELRLAHSWYLRSYRGIVADILCGYSGLSRTQLMICSMPLSWCTNQAMLIHVRSQGYPMSMQGGSYSRRACCHGWSNSCHGVMSHDSSELSVVSPSAQSHSACVAEVSKPHLVRESSSACTKLSTDSYIIWKFAFGRLLRDVMVVMTRHCHSVPTV